MREFYDKSSNYISRYGILHFLIASKHISANNLKTFLNKRNDININGRHKNHKGGTALHVAVINGNYKKAEILVNKGAKTNIKDNNNKTPFDYANNSRMEAILLKPQLKNLALVYASKGIPVSLAYKFVYNGFSNNRKRIVKG